MGDVIGDLNSRRGKVLGMDRKGQSQVIKALVPMSEILKYAPDLRSMTSGRGSFEAHFSHYEEAPPPVTEKIVKEAREAREAAPKERTRTPSAGQGGGRIAGRARMRAGVRDDGAVGKGTDRAGADTGRAGSGGMGLRRRGRYRGRLPGDIYVRRGNFSFYFPITTCDRSQHRAEPDRGLAEALSDGERNIRIHARRADCKRRRRELIAVGVAATMLVAFVLAQTELPPLTRHTSLVSNLVVILLFDISFLLLGLLLLLVGRNLAKVIFEHRRGLIGSKFQVRLVFGFIAVALVPSVFLLFVAGAFLRADVDSWFNPEYERVLDDSLEIAKIYYLNSANNAAHFARVIAGQVAAQGPAAARAARRAEAVHRASASRNTTSARSRCSPTIASCCCSRSAPGLRPGSACRPIRRCSRRRSRARR